MCRIAPVPGPCSNARGGVLSGSTVTHHRLIAHNDPSSSRLNYGPHLINGFEFQEADFA